MHNYIIIYKNNNGDSMIYLVIFISKIIENALATLRIIVVSNGKKKLGAILQGLVTLVWLLVTGVVIIDINNDPLKILFFCFGSVSGSYIGSLIEEKIALGSVKLIIKSERYKEIYLKLNIYHIELYNKQLEIITKRRNIKRIVDTILKIDQDSKIITEKIKIYGKLTIL